MSKHREAYEAWQKIQKYCKETNCNKCVFKSPYSEQCTCNAEYFYGNDFIVKRIEELERQEKQ